MYLSTTGSKKYYTWYVWLISQLIWYDMMTVIGLRLWPIFVSWTNINSQVRSKYPN